MAPQRMIKESRHTVRVLTGRCPLNAWIMNRYKNTGMEIIKPVLPNKPNKNSLRLINSPSGKRYVTRKITKRDSSTIELMNRVETCFCTSFFCVVVFEFLTADDLFSDNFSVLVLVTFFVIFFEDAAARSA